MNLGRCLLLEAWGVQPRTLVLGPEKHVVAWLEVGMDKLPASHPAARSYGELIQALRVLKNVKARGFRLRIAICQNWAGEAPRDQDLGEPLRQPSLPGGLREAVLVEKLRF